MPDVPRGKRSTDQTQISISLPKALLEKIDDYAEKEKRARSNWIVFTLLQRIEALEALEAEQKTAAGKKPKPGSVTNFPAPSQSAVRAAEESPPYKARPKKS